MQHTAVTGRKYPVSTGEVLSQHMPGISVYRMLSFISADTYNVIIKVLIIVLGVEGP